MDTKTLKNVPLMQAANANGIEFTIDDLHVIEHTFGALGLGGRIPLKVGHEGPDARDNPESQFALGWVERVWVQGEQLLADFSGIPAKAFDWIKAGLLKFVSVELLKNVKAGNRHLPWVLDAVALLGTDQPAFGDLGDLQSLAMKRGPKLQAESRFTFSLGAGEDETVKLRRQNAELTRQLVASTFETAIMAGRILPRDRESFKRRYGDRGTLADATEWIESAAKPADFSTSPQSLLHTPRSADPFAAIVEATNARITFERKENNRTVTYQEAALLVARDPANKELMRAYMDAPSNR